MSAPRTIGAFHSQRWGQVTVLRGTYGKADGPTAVMLQCDDEPLAVLSVNMYRPDCSRDSIDLPPDCFYVKTWSENESLIGEAFASGLFVLRADLPQACSGYVQAPVWQIKT